MTTAATPTARTDRRTGTTTIDISASPSDVASMSSLLRRGVRVGNEDCERDTHLSDLIVKPWGREYRLFADDFIDLWHLQIQPGQTTSMHAHPRKTTYLLCLSGTGATSTLTGEHEFGPGAVLRIGRGAFHATRNTGADPLMVVEVETPRNKLDLLRLRDAYDRAGQGYETDGEALTVAPRKVRFLPNAVLCRESPCRAWTFEIIAGMDVHYRRHTAGSFLIPLGFEALIADHMEILTDHPDDDRRPQLDAYYLAVRCTA